MARKESLRMDGVCRLDEEFASILAARVKGRFFKGPGTKGREEKRILQLQNHLRKVLGGKEHGII